MANGSFGSNDNRRTIIESENRRERRLGIGSFFANLSRRAGMISPVHWVDIVCCVLFLGIGIAMACNWSGFMDALFYEVLFPVICVGGKILAIAAVIAIIIGIISFRFRRRRYW